MNDGNVEGCDWLKGGLSEMPPERDVHAYLRGPLPWPM